MITFQELCLAAAAGCAIGTAIGLWYLIRGKGQNRFFGAATAVVAIFCCAMFLWIGFNLHLR